MEYKTILVHLDQPERAARIVSVALRIAERFDSVVNGLYVVPSLEVLASLASGGAGPEFVRQRRTELFEQSEECERIFNSTLASTHHESHWQVVDSKLGRVGDEVLRHVRTTDLTVLSQTPKEEDIIFASETPESLVLNGGRPVLIVPLGYEVSDQFGHNALIAWDGSKEASRALWDSLPMLKRAQHVKSVWVVNDDIDASEVADVKWRFEKWLTRHGIAGSLQVVDAENKDPATIIDGLIENTQSYLLIAGGYGDSRLKEYLTGGRNGSGNWRPNTVK